MTGDQKNSVLGKYRYALKSAIHGAGFRTITEYSAYIGTDIAKISRIINGWEIPNPLTEKAMAVGLGITIKELRGLL